MSVMLLEMADGSPPVEVKILTDSDILQKELSVMTVMSERWMERFVMNPQVLCWDGLTSDYDLEDRCSDVDGEEGVFQDPIPEVVSVRPEITEKWIDRFVIDLVESPSVSRKSAVSALQLVVSDTVRVSVPPVAGCEFPAALLGKVAFDAVGLGVGPPCFRVDSEDALQKRTDERALLACAALGVIPEMKLVTKFWMMGRRETTTGVNSLEYVLQMTAPVWMPFNQTCEEESDDANFDSFKRRPGTPVGRNRMKCMRHCADKWYRTLTDRRQR